MRVRGIQLRRIRPLLEKPRGETEMPIPFPKGQHSTLLWLPQYEPPGHLSGKKVKA